MLSVFAIGLGLSTVPSAALDVAAPEIDNGPGPGGPGDVEAPDLGGGNEPGPGDNGGNGGGNGGGGNGGGGFSDDDGNTISSSTTRRASGNGGCLFGRWVTTYHADAQGQPIPGTLERECVRRLRN
ncbi:hypothetical protein [Gymnodinialimonas mytili]|uniref:hypothetical protein n=1 Tax=Gymnodinialimonas mytili TaxID=3126503 RepID=UPI0030ED9F34